MSVVHVVIDRSASETYQGVKVFDRDNGGTFVGGAGSAFPSSPVPGEWFWRTDEARLYRRNTEGTAWDAVASSAVAHKTTHEPGGGDALTVDAAAGTGSLRTIGTGALQSCAGNDARLSDARTPTSHASTHKSGGADAIKLDELAAPTDITTLNVSTMAHGLAPKLSNVASQFLNGVGGWTTPAGSIFGSDYQTAISTERSTTTSATMQDKTTLTTGALTGTYRVGWCAVVDVASPNREVQAQLYNVTDAVVIGVAQDQRPSASAQMLFVGGFAEVTFTGAAKTFKIQFGSVNGSTTVGIQDARIELWRVS